MKVMAETNENAPATKADLNAGLGSLRLEMLERLDHVETTLLKEFRKWAVRNDSTLRVHDARSIGYDQRLSVLEERVAELEDRK
jgi:hypothetical protein